MSDTIITKLTMMIIMIIIITKSYYNDILRSVIVSSPRNFSLKLMFFSRLFSDRALRKASGLL